MYIHRDEKGIMRTQFTNQLAQKIINEFKGEFFKNKNNKTCFRLLDDGVYSLEYDDLIIKITFWAGDVLIPI